MIKSYEDIAKESGFDVMKVIYYNEWFWFNDSKELIARENYKTKLDAWRACCIENNLLQGG